MKSNEKKATQISRNTNEFPDPAKADPYMIGTMTHAEVLRG